MGGRDRSRSPSRHEGGGTDGGRDRDRRDRDSSSRRNDRESSSRRDDRDERYGRETQPREYARDGDRERHAEGGNRRGGYEGGRDRDESRGRGGYDGGRDRSGNRGQDPSEGNGGHGGRGGRGGYDGGRGSYGGRGRGDQGGYRGGDNGGYRGDRGGGSGYRGRGDRGGGGGFGGGGRQGPPVQINLPETVPVPEAGMALNFPEYKMRGREGQHIKVAVNHFEIQSLPPNALFAYDMQVLTAKLGEEETECKEPMAIRIINDPKIQEELRKIVPDTAIFDGVSIVYATAKLPLPQNPYKFELKLRTRTFSVVLRERAMLEMEHLVKFVQMVHRSTELHQSLSENAPAHDGLVFLNALLRHQPSKKFLTSDSRRATTFYDRGGLGGSRLQSNPVLEAWSGWFQAVTVRFGRLTVNVDTATVAFLRPGMNFVDFVAESLGMRRENVEHEYQRSPHQIFEMLSKLKKCRFTTHHMQRTSQWDKYHIVKKIEPKGASELTFKKKKFTTNESGETEEASEEQSIADYFSEHYKINLDFKMLPCVEDARGSWFPLELCFVGDAERWREHLTPNETADFIKQATAPAFIRKTKIMENVSKVAWHDNKELANFGVSIKPRMIELPARVLQAPTPQYARGTDHNAPSTGRWNLRGKMFIKPKPVISWGLLYLKAPGTFMSRNMQDEDVLRELGSGMATALRSHGIEMPRDPPPFHFGNIQALENTVKEFGMMCKKVYGRFPNLLVFPLLGQATELYKSIKYLGDIKFGVATQCILMSKYTAQRQPAQYLSNIALKVNNKLGGTNSTIRDSFLNNENLGEGVMVLGADASHPNPSQLRLNPPPPTVTALASTYDYSCSRYSAVTGSQAIGMVNIEGFAEKAQVCIARWKECQNREPDKILYFRSGLTEDQYKFAFEQELKELKAVTKAKVTFVVALKRHHTRIFPLGESDKLGNVLPGTVVENDHGKDIFVVAHPGLQGTVRPTHYRCIYDENKLSDDVFQRVCTAQCFNYGRATTAVSLVPPVYYAKLACERARMHYLEGAAEGKPLQQVKRALFFSMWWA